MGIAVKIKDLRKTYSSAPPLASGATAAFFGGSSKGAKPKKDVHIVALDGISLDVAPGEVFGLLGPNGAGKSTTIGILTTRVRPSGGEAWIGGYEVTRQPVKVKENIGVVQQRPNLDFALTAREILLFHGAYYGIQSAERTRRAAGLLDRFQLSARADELVRGFSGGMMQRLSIARAMMHDPNVLFLDEPSTGLDPQTRLLLWEIIREYNAKEKTIVLTTHNMEEADALCRRIAIVDRGKALALGTPGELKASIPGGYLLRLRFSRPTAELVEYLARIEGVTEVRTQGDSVDLYASRGGAMIGEVAAAAGVFATELLDVHISEPSLENLFLHHTGRSLRQ